MSQNAPNILITGAAGYIGGSVLADLSNRTSGRIACAKLFAAVRSADQASRLGNSGITMIQLDITDEEAVKETISHHDIDIVLHIASSHDPSVVSFLIQALGERRGTTGKERHFVHTSGTTAFAPEAGWPDMDVKDTDDVFEMEKKLSAHHPIRLTDIRVTEAGEEHGVNTFIVVVPSVYGKGSGEGKKLSIAFPVFVRASVRDKLVHQFDTDGSPAVAHVSDITAFYGLLTESILQGNNPPSGKDGYYFPMAHKTSNWAVMRRFAEGLHAIGLVSEPVPRTWPSDEAAAESLGIPFQIVRIMGTHSTRLVPIKPAQLGWQPRWTEEMLLESIDQEIQDVLEADRVQGIGA